MGLVSCETETHADNTAMSDGKSDSSSRPMSDNSDKRLNPAAQLSQKHQRLKMLLDQATVYSKFLSSKFIKQQETDNAQGAESCAVQPSETPASQPSRTLVSQPALVTGGVLKPYQLEGLEWLVSLYENGLNGILADEMGLGKTLQCISFLAFLREKGVHGPFLITAPLSTLSNWAAEIARFAPNIPCLVYHGNKTERAALRQQYFGSRQSRGRTADMETFPIIIVSYEIVMNDKSYLEPFKWKFIIVDEGHRIKNLNCKLIKTLKEFDSANRLLLTGTPLQNNLAELWSLLNFLLPDIFDDLDVFQRWFDVPGLADATRSVPDGDDSSSLTEQHRLSIVANLHNILKPFLLRRLKVDVERDLPPKKEYVIYCSLTPLQRQYYQAALTRRLAPFIESLIEKDTCRSEAKRSPTVSVNNDRPLPAKRTANARLVEETGDDDVASDDEFLKRLEREADYSFEQEVDDATFLTETRTSRATQHMRSIKLQNLFVQLRKVCNHPYLFFRPVDPHTEQPQTDEQLLEASGKLLILDQLLPALIARNHRTLLFSQMTGVMDILEDYLAMRGIRFCRIDGATSHREREEQLSVYRSDASIPVFLLSTRAAGLGINLVVADTVIFYDSDWNPQMDLQAQDRAHRIGQTRPVLIYRLATAGTIEAKILERASSKRRLERVVIHKARFKGIKELARGDSAGIKAEELRRILEEESAHVVQQTGDKDCSVPTRLSAKELDYLLDRSEATFSKDAEEIDSARFSVAKPMAGGLNDTLAAM